MSESIHVSVVHAWPDAVFLRELDLPAGSTVADAVAASGLYVAHPETRRGEPRYGIFSKRVSEATTLRDGDRVEVYRALALDPKLARRQRAERRARD